MELLFHYKDFLRSEGLGRWLVKLLLIASKSDSWKCKLFLIQTEIIWMDSSQFPLSKHVSLRSERTADHCSTRSIRSVLEAPVLKKGVATPGLYMLKLQLIWAGNQRWDKNVFTYMPWVRIGIILWIFIALLWHKISGLVMMRHLWVEYSEGIINHTGKV